MKIIRSEIFYKSGYYYWYVFDNQIYSTHETNQSLKYFFDHATSTSNIPSSIFIKDEPEIAIAWEVPLLQYYHCQYIKMNSMKNKDYMDFFKIQYNLSQEEIDALILDIEKEAKALNPNNEQLSFDFSLVEKVRDHNEIGCVHEYEMYTGLKESFEHCKKCGEKK